MTGGELEYWLFIGVFILLPILVGLGLAVVIGKVFKTTKHRRKNNL